jgi:hypothetical protein
MVATPFSTLSAALYVPNLTGTFSGQALAGVDSWTQNEANNPDTSPLAFVAEIGGSPGAAVGGFYAEPTSVDPFIASRPINTPLASSTLCVDFAIQDSTSLFPSRNDFSIGLSNGATNLFSIVFMATDPNPTDPSVTSAFWNVSVESDAAGPFSAFGSIGEDAPYSLTVGFTPNGADMDFNLSLVGNVGSPFTQTGTLSGLAGAQIENFNLGFSKGKGDGFGDNFLVIKGTADSVPDTGSTMALLGLSLAAVLRFGKSARK